LEDLDIFGGPAPVQRSTQAKIKEVPKQEVKQPTHSGFSDIFGLDEDLFGGSTSHKPQQQNTVKQAPYPDPVVGGGDLMDLLGGDGNTNIQQQQIPVVQAQQPNDLLGYNTANARVNNNND